MASNVIKINQATVVFATDQAGLATEPDFTCQVNSAAIVSDPKLTTVPATFCGAETQAAAASGFHMELTFLQDWGATDSLSQFLFDNDGAAVWFKIVPTDANLANVPGAEGQCWCVAGQYLGDAAVPVQATVSMPLLAKPNIATSITRTAGTQGTQPLQPAGVQPAGV